MSTGKRIAALPPWRRWAWWVWSEAQIGLSNG
jgi:hypothetical protein